MVNIIEVYKCICGRVYLDIKEAEKCESQKIIDPFNPEDVFKFKCRSDLFLEFGLNEGILKIINKSELTYNHIKKYSVAAICYNNQFEEIQRNCVFIQKELTAKDLQNANGCSSFGRDFKKLEKGELEKIIQENPEVKKMWEERIELE